MRSGIGGERSWSLRCDVCGESAAEFGYTCAACDGPLLMELDGAGSPQATARDGLWRWSSLLPRVGVEVTLGEGGTPLIAHESGSGEVLLKMESLNPTLSFKDRAMALAASFAKAEGSAGLSVASTGNAAVSAAAYAAAAGIPCRVFVGTASNALRKLDAARAYGAVVEEVPGDYSTAYALAAEAESEGWLNVSTTYRNPLLAEAYRPIAFELIDQLGGVPAVVVVPIGAGPLLRGIERGFADAVAAGLADSSPALIGVQAGAVAPIAQAWRTGTAVRAGEPGVTSATAIADRLDGYARHGDITIDAVRRSGGSVVAVDEGEIAAATLALVRRGIWVEPAAATALAALPQITAAASGPTVLMMTGHGVKAPLPESVT